MGILACCEFYAAAASHRVFRPALRYAVASSWQLILYWPATSSHLHSLSIPELWLTPAMNWAVNLKCLLRGGMVVQSGR